MNKKTNHCCIAMQQALDDIRVYFGYIPKYKEYYINTKNPIVIYIISHCPWCGKKLPSNLTDKWFEILEKEYNLDDPDSKEQAKLVPEEFKTDEWWIKRGL